MGTRVRWVGGSHIIQIYIGSLYNDLHHQKFIFAGAARSAGPDSMLILCVSVCVSEIISRTLIGRKTRTSLRGMSSTKATYLLQQQNKKNNGRLS